MKADKVGELFQIMVIVNLNMGNFTLEVNSLKIMGSINKELDKQKLNEFIAKPMHDVS
jgi:hypothetical protein